MSEKRYYWLKLPTDFFKRHDVNFIKSLPKGPEIALFYIELMAESVGHDGELRFSKDIPYTNKMLASVTNTPEEVVDEAMKTLQEFGLIKIDKKGTIIIPRVLKMVGSASNSDAAQRQRRCREKKKERDKMSQQSVTSVTDSVTKDNESIEIEKELEKDIEIDKRESREKKARSHFEPPTVEQVYLYCEERHNGIDAQRFVDYYTARGWKNVTDWKAQIRVWESKITVPYETQ